VLGLFAGTSALAVLYGVRRRRRARGALPGALLRAAELAGLTVVFVALNLGAGVAAVLVLRAVGAGFTSMYLNADATILGLSVLQAAAWQWWRKDG
jgi:hypothetical protein